MNNESEIKRPIRIGLILAGAVTAGCFTAGALDYLFNTLRMWEEAYVEDQRKDPADRLEIPKPSIMIDVIAGASAGSMNAAVALLALLSRKFESEVKREGKSVSIEIEAERNLLYQTWVNYLIRLPEDKVDGLLATKLFSTSDISGKDSEKVKSLINAKLIEDVVDELKKILKKTGGNELPAFVNSKLEVLMTLSNLRGIPVDLSFGEERAHRMTYHKAYAHFKRGHSNEDKGKYSLDFKSDNDIDNFLRCARASGAFPIGLRSVYLSEIEKEYIEINLKKIFQTDSITPQVPDIFEFQAVDGGMTNNEPIGEALRIMKDFGHGEAVAKKLLMIDPFPSSSEELSREDLEKKDSLLDIVGGLYTTLRNQVRFKENDIKELFTEESKGPKRGMIWPTRFEYVLLDGQEKRNEAKPPIATEAIDGFAGFFHHQFRIHDYKLGMKNCQNYLRWFYSQEPKAAALPEEYKWSEKFKKEFYKRTKRKEGRALPVILDMREFGDPGLTIKEGNGVPDYPQIQKSEVFTPELRKLIRRRTKGVLSRLLFKDLLSIPRKTASNEHDSKGGLRNKIRIALILIFALPVVFLTLLPFIILVVPWLVPFLIRQLNRYILKKLEKGLDGQKVFSD